MSDFDDKRDANCERCNYDTHRCPGCGEPLPHGTVICVPCDDEFLAEEINQEDDRDYPAHGY